MRLVYGGALAENDIRLPFFDQSCAGENSGPNPGNPWVRNMNQSIVVFTKLVPYRLDRRRVQDRGSARSRSGRSTGHVPDRPSYNIEPGSMALIMRIDDPFSWDLDWQASIFADVGRQYAQAVSFAMEIACKLAHSNRANDIPRRKMEGDDQYLHLVAIEAVERSSRRVKAMR